MSSPYQSQLLQERSGISPCQRSVVGRITIGTGTAKFMASNSVKVSILPAVTNTFNLPDNCNDHFQIPCLSILYMFLFHNNQMCI